MLRPSSVTANTTEVLARHATHLARRGSDCNLAADLAHDTGVVVKPGYVRLNL